MEAEWYIREYRCANGICVKTKFPGREDSAARPGTREYDREIRRAERGSKDSKRELALKLNSNFRAGRDAYLGFDYSDEAYDRLVARAGTDERDAVYAEAQREMVNFIRRARRECEKAGIELRYAYVTSDLDGKTLGEVRVHHHMVVNKEAAAICAEKWNSGGVWSRKLYGARHGDLSDLAEYMVGQVRYAKDEKRYTPSRNLRKAEALNPRKAKNSEAELRVPKSCELIWRSEAYVGRPQLVRYFRPGAENEEEQ